MKLSDKPVFVLFTETKETVAVKSIDSMSMTATAVKSTTPGLFLCFLFGVFFILTTFLSFIITYAILFSFYTG